MLQLYRNFMIQRGLNLYHIPEDKRAKDSALKIYKSLRRLLFVKQLSEISVTDIKNECGVSRATFYRLFDNLSDVLEMQLEIFMDEYKQELPHHKDRLLYFFEFFDKHTYLIATLASQNDSVIRDVMERKFTDFSSLSNSTSPAADYGLNLRISMMTSLLCKWVLREKKESPLQMAELTRKLLSQGELLLTQF